MWRHVYHFEDTAEDGGRRGAQLACSDVRGVQRGAHRFRSVVFYATVEGGVVEGSVRRGTQLACRGARGGLRE